MSNDYVVCPICKKKLKKLDGGHIQRVHGITSEEFKTKFPNSPTKCESYMTNLSNSIKKKWKDGDYAHVSSVISGLWANGTYDRHSDKVKQAHAKGKFSHIYTPERSRKISEAQKGIPKSDACKAKIAQAHKDGRYDNAPAKISAAIKRRWEEGRYNHVDWVNLQLQPETVLKKRRAIQELHEQGRYRHIYQDPNVLQKMSNTRKRAWLDGKYDGVFKSPSNLEMVFARKLDAAGIPYDQQYRIGTYKADFLVDDNMVVELNGDYWHGTPEAAEYDRQRNKWIEVQGYKVIVIWEGEFYADPDKYIRMIETERGHNQVPSFLL